MTDLPPSGGSEDRTLGLDPVDGLSFESDGTPISELAVESLDRMVDRGATVAELAQGRRSWRFGHVIVDEAQDLTPMQWRMIERRSLGGSMTIVGDLAQRSIGEPGTWADHLPPTLSGFGYRELTINYRSPREVNALAASVLSELAPELAPSQAIRAVGHEPVVTALPDLAESLLGHLSAVASSAVGRMAVISMTEPPQPVPRALHNVPWLTPWQAKGLEFDSVVLVEPAEILEQSGGLSLLYVGITRTTDRLDIVHRRPLPGVLERALA